MTTTQEIITEHVTVYVDTEDYDGPSVFVHVITSETAPVHVLVDGEEVYA